VASHFETAQWAPFAAYLPSIVCALGGVLFDLAKGTSRYVNKIDLHNKLVKDMIKALLLILRCLFSGQTFILLLPLSSSWPIAGGPKNLALPMCWDMGRHFVFVMLMRRLLLLDSQQFVAHPKHQVLTTINGLGWPGSPLIGACA